MEQLISVRSLFKETDAYAGKQIKVGGWVRNLRASKNFGFINLSDGTFFSQVQVVYGSELANFTEISKLNIGAAVIVTGTLVLTPDAKQPFELQASEVFVEGPSTPDYPIQPKRHSMEYLRTVTHLRPRTNTFQAVFRVRSLIAYAISSMSIPRSSPAPTARAQAKCSRSQRSILTICRARRTARSTTARTSSARRRT